MNEHAIRKILEGGGGWPGAVIRAVLWLPGILYGALMELRRTFYLCGMMDVFRPAVPTVSVGNLTAGGSGKTPFTVMLARELAAAGRKPGILLRGYRSHDDISDEAVLYKKSCPEAVVEVGADRRASAKRAVEAGANVLLLDDGMQHLRVKRDLDIVLVDATSPWGGGNTFPGGLLREPKTTLRYAGIVVLTRSNQVPDERVEALKAEIARLAPAAMQFTARHAPARLYRLDDSQLPLSALDGRRVVALSGIARPEAFEKTLVELGAIVAGSVAGRDHDGFNPEILRRAADLAASEKAVVIITEKDRSKKIFSELADNTSMGEVWTLGVDQSVDDQASLMSRIAMIVGAGKTLS